MIDERIAKLAPTFFICPMCGERVEWNHGTLDSCTADDPFLHTCADGQTVKIFLDRENERIRFDTSKFCDAQFGGYSEENLVFAGSEAGVPVLEFFDVAYRNYDWCTGECEKSQNCIFERAFICDEGFWNEFGRMMKLSARKVVFKLEFEKTEYQKARDEWFKSRWLVREKNTLTDCIAKFTPNGIWDHEIGSWHRWGGGLIELYGLGKKGIFGKQKIEFLFHRARRVREYEFTIGSHNIPASVDGALCPVLSNSVARLDKLFFENESDTPILELSLEWPREELPCKKCDLYDDCLVRFNRLLHQVELKKTFFGTSLKFKLRLDPEEYRKLRKELERKF